MYFTSGAGSLVNTVDQVQESTRHKVLGVETVSASVGAQANSHTYQTIFNEAVAGFTQSTFSADFKTLTTNVISYTGEVVYKFQSNKAGQEV